MHLDQLPLEPEELLEIVVPLVLVRVMGQRAQGGVGGELLPVVALHLELLVVVVDQLPVDPPHQLALLVRYVVGVV
jgi:hypothetical protein